VFQVESDKGFTKATSVLTVLLLLASLFSTFHAAGSALAGVNRAEVQSVREQVERVRGLRASGEVQARYMSRADLKSKILEDLEEEKPRQELRAAEEIMKMLGLIPQDLDLENLLVELYTEQIGGFYDPEDNSLYLVAEESSMNVMDRLTLAHELVHFLQDSRFELDRPPFSEKGEEVDDDGLFAASCLVEGDAMLTSQLWARDYLSPTEIVQLGQLSREVPTEVLDRAPPYAKESLLFPYQGGMEFVSHLYRKGGFAAVDRAFEDPPRSSEEVMHPEKYVDGERPMEVALPSLGDAGWEKAYENVLGEFDVHQLFSLYVPEQEARRAAEGWGGNRYAYYRAPKGNQVLASVFAWDSPTDAKEFSEVFGRHLEGRFGGVSPRAHERGWELVEAGGYRYAWRVAGRTVLLVQATSAATLEAAREALEGAGLGEETEGGAEEDEATGYSADRSRLVLVISLVSALFLLGLALSVFILISNRHRPPQAGS
jgi:hypothetical protein